jgi:hypothetical protein
MDEMALEFACIVALAASPRALSKLRVKWRGVCFPGFVNLRYRRKFVPNVNVVATETSINNLT